MKNVVIIGGGTGTFTLLEGLRKFPVNDSVIVSTADDGGSTGRLRKELGILPPGDIRQCLLGLAYTDPILRELFNYRFDKGSLSGHSVGNIILAALEKITKDPDEAITVAAKLLNVRGSVVPVTLYPTTLSAVLSNGKKIVGEHAIDEPKSGKRPAIKSLKLSPSRGANPRALSLIRNADAIIFGPGDLFTSTIPNLLVAGVAEAVAKSKAKKILITNIMTKQGQTDDFKVSDFVSTLEDYLGGKSKLGKLDIVISNNKKPAQKDLAYYRRAHAKYVVPDLKSAVAKPLLSVNRFNHVKGDILKRSVLRHDSHKTAKLIWDLIS